MGRKEGRARTEGGNEGGQEGCRALLGAYKELPAMDIMRGAQVTADKSSLWHWRDVGPNLDSPLRTGPVTLTLLNVTESQNYKKTYKSGPRTG